MRNTFTVLVLSGHGSAADSLGLLRAIGDFNTDAAARGVQWVPRLWHDEIFSAAAGRQADAWAALLHDIDLLVVLPGQRFDPALDRILQAALGRRPVWTWLAQHHAQAWEAGLSPDLRAALHAAGSVAPYRSQPELRSQFLQRLNRFAAPPAPPARRGGPDGGEAGLEALFAGTPGFNHPMAVGAEPPAPAAAAQPAAAAAAAIPLPAGLPPTAARADRPPQPPEVPPVDAAVFCPPQVARASTFLVQVFLYPPAAAAAVAAEAQQNDPTAQSMARVSLPLDVPQGARVALRLDMPTLRVDEPDALLVWRGVASAAQFEVAVPAELAAHDAIGRVRLAVDGVPVGTLRFRLQLLPAGSRVQPAAAAAGQARRYRRAFVSYSSKDRAEVLRRVQAFKIAGLSVFQDILDLDPGERWARALYREIDNCDVFLLFWSQAAAASEWVAKEIDYALDLQGGDGDRPPAIQPVPIEGPPIVPPPPRLGALHFNDALLAQIAAAGAPPAPRP